MKKSLIAILVLALLLTCGCASAGKTEEAVPDPTAEPAPAAEPAKTGDEKNISRDLQEFLANYEDFADEYIGFMTEYLKANPGEMLSMLGEYTEYAEKYADFAEQIKDFDTSSLTSEELAYFREVTDRVARKLAELIER